MGKVDRSEGLTVGGYLFGGSGLMLCGDAIGCARTYGYTGGTVAEFTVGIVCIIAATAMLYIAGMMRDRHVQAEFARRRAAREQRKAERERRIR